MLVLSRKLGEEILIAGIVSVKVIQIKGNQVKLGIDGPKDIPVHRKELVNGTRQVNPVNS